MIHRMTMSRYHRQMLLPAIGEEGQRRISSAHALVVGCGALGCTIADLLVRGGVGMLTIVDRDVVELTNLQRQSLFDERDVAEGLPKAEAARRHLALVNAEVRVRAIVADFTAGNAEEIAVLGSAALRAESERDESPDQSEAREGVPRYPEPADKITSRAAQIIIDGTDNFETRYLMNDLAVKHRVPLVYGGAVGTRGMQMTIRAGGRPCLRCLFEEMPAPGAAPTCDTAGILAPAAVIVAAHQAADALRILAGDEQAVGGRLLDFDLWSTSGVPERRLDVTRMDRSDCPCCGLGRFEFLQGAREGGSTTTLCGRSSVQVAPQAAAEPVDLAKLAERLRPHGSFTSNRFLLRGQFVQERSADGQSLGLTVFADGRALVHGTVDPVRARVIYARYIGG
jgi:molybdopterin-synthase adenylyltransferase